MVERFVPRYVASWFVARAAQLAGGEPRRLRQRHRQRHALAAKPSEVRRVVRIAGNADDAARRVPDAHATSHAAVRARAADFGRHRATANEPGAKSPPSLMTPLIRRDARMVEPGIDTP